MRNLSVVETNAVVGGLAYDDVKGYVRASVGGAAFGHGAELFAKRDPRALDFVGNTVKGIGGGLAMEVAHNVMNRFGF